METCYWIISLHADPCKWKGAAIRITVFNDIGVKLVTFWISLCDTNTFITQSMLMPVFDETDLLLTNGTVWPIVRRVRFYGCDRVYVTDDVRKFQRNIRAYGIFSS